jgi:hypothetical protein
LDCERSLYRSAQYAAVSAIKDSESKSMRWTSRREPCGGGEGEIVEGTGAGAGEVGAGGCADGLDSRLLEGL